MSALVLRLVVNTMAGPVNRGQQQEVVVQRKPPSSYRLGFYLARAGEEGLAVKLGLGQ